MGVSDYQVENGRSRPAHIIRQIKALIEHGLIADEFSVLDICCGDAIVLWQIKRAFPRASCYGVDFNKGKLSTHQKVQRDGVQVYRVFIQHLFHSHPDTPFDLALMLNTYRGWESADLREHERDLPELAENWFARNSLCTILTATNSQILHLQRLGFVVMGIGRGEDSSTMICISKLRLPVSFWRRLLPFRIRVGGAEAVSQSWQQGLQRARRVAAKTPLRCLKPLFRPVLRRLDSQQW